MSEQLTQLPAVAQRVPLQCKKCSAERFFIVVAHKDEKSAKVKCEVCNSTKTFKLTAPKKPRVTRKKEPAGPNAQQVWSDLIEKHKNLDSLKYNMKAQFQSPGIIDHPKFGVGFVTMASNDKIQVQFEDAIRQLVHNRR